MRYIGTIINKVLPIYNFTVNALNYNIQTVNCEIKIHDSRKNNPQTTILLTVTWN